MAPSGRSSRPGSTSAAGSSARWETASQTGPIGLAALCLEAHAKSRPRRSIPRSPPLRSPARTHQNPGPGDRLLPWRRNRPVPSGRGLSGGQRRAVSLEKGGSVGGRSGVRPPTEPTPLRGTEATIKQAWQSTPSVASRVGFRAGSWRFVAVRMILRLNRPRQHAYTTGSGSGQPRGLRSSVGLRLPYRAGRAFRARVSSPRSDARVGRSGGCARAPKPGIGSMPPTGAADDGTVRRASLRALGQLRHSSPAADHS